MTTGPKRRILATALVLAMVVAGCADDTEPRGTGAEVDQPAESPPETPEAPDAPADADDPDDAVEDDTDDAVDDATDLADGRHPTYLRAIEQAGRTLTVDVIQFLTGQAAIDAHDKDHPDEPGGPPNDYYIVNVNPRLRTLEVASDVTVALVRLHEDGDADLDPGTWDELTDYLAVNPPEDDRLSWNPYWVTLEDGIVVAIEEQYLP
jgi:hypothetical protein